MAKRPTRTDADDSAAMRPRTRTRPQQSRELGAAAVASHEPDPLKTDEHGNAHPESISGRLDDGAQVQQSPGDAMADRTAFGTATASDLDAREPGEPSEEDIRLRAYHMYLERGGGHGMDFDDWVRAQEELRSRSRR